jgi:hypothetical protein
LQVRLGTGTNVDVGSSEDTFSLTLISTTTNSLLRLYPKVGDLFNGSIDNVSVKEYTSADMDVTRATDATRVDENGLIADVLSNVPRIDYTGGGCPHILAEPQRTNLIPYSEDFSESAWTKTRCTIDSGGHTSPSGESNAFKMTATDDDARLQDGSEAAGVVYTQSIYVKSATGSNVSGQIDFTGTQIQTFTATSEWQRVDTTSDDTRAGVVRVRITNSGDELYIWGAQLEVGSYATSYIPTSGSTVTRNQDIFTRDGIGSLIGSEGVLFIEMAALSNDLTNRVISLNDGTSSNRLMLYLNSLSNTIAVVITSGGSTINYAVSDETSFNKMAVRYRDNDLTLWVDGQSRGTPITSATIPTFTALKFDSGGGSSPFFGKVKQLQVYDTALTDTQLAALTS